MARIAHDVPETFRRPCSLALGLVLACLLLTACGGGGGAPAETATEAKAVAEAAAGTATSEPAEPASLAVADDAPGLVAGPIDTVDTGPAGTRVVRAIGSLAGGGHAVVWAAPLPDTPAPAWTLWVQAYDRHAARQGSPAMLDVGTHVQDPRNASAVILPEGGVAVGYLATRAADPGDPGTDEATAYTTRFSLDGQVVYGPRQLDSLVFDRFYPRSNRLAGPVTMALGQDGSYLVSWRFVAGSYFGRQSTFRIQRLAADTEPLGWLQHLNRNDLSGAFLAFDRLRLTLLDEGGWVASFADRYPDLGLLGRVVQNDVARPLHVPSFGTLAPGAWVLDLRRHGSVLFADPRSDAPGTPVAPYSMHFDRLGREQDPVRGMPAIPTAAAALRGGDYVAMWHTGSATLDARRYAPRGRPVGAPFTLRAAADAEVAGLQRGGMALAWVDTEGAFSRVMTQRLNEPASP